MKLFIYVGSKRKENSRSMETVELIKKNLMNKGNIHEADINVYYAHSITVRECTGCCCCFYTGKCPQDKMDDMAAIKADLLSSDCVIFISPVYLHSVSGVTKTFIDRISYWAHLFKLIGKFGLVISVSSTNGNEYVDYYLEKVQHSMGVSVVDKCSLPLDLIDGEEFTNRVEKSLGKLLDCYNNVVESRPTQKQEFLFTTYKDMLLNSGKKNAEYLDWERNGLFEFSSFSEAFEAKRAIFLTNRANNSFISINDY